jgi:chromosomal replication initiation ATPase DnaA
MIAIDSIVLEKVNLSHWIRPGIEHLDEQYIINMISTVFKLPSSSWVNADNRRQENTVPRQLLMTCLIDHLQYTTVKAGDVCGGRSHCTAVYSRMSVLNTLWNDKTFGNRIRIVYNAIKAFKNERS